MSTHEEKKPRTARAWAELVWYAECPYCGALEELGEGVAFSKGEEMECRCGNTYILPEQKK